MKTNQTLMLIYFACMLNILQAYGQSSVGVAINTDGAPAHPSAMLDVQSANKGFLAPRMTQIQRDAILNAAEGLLIYQTDAAKGFYFYDATNETWVPVGGNASPWVISGSNIYYDEGNVGIGTQIPEYGLHLVKNQNEVTRALSVRIDGDSDEYITNYAGYFLNNSIWLGVALHAEALSEYGTALVAKAPVNAIHAVANSEVGRAIYANNEDNNGLVLEVIGSRSYFDGSLGLGTDIPTNKLHVLASQDPLRLEGLQTSTQSEMLVVDADGVVSKRNIEGGFWSVLGNSGTSPTTNFIGTYDNQSLAFRTNNIERMRLTSQGLLGIGLTSAEAMIDIKAPNAEPGQNAITALRVIGGRGGYGDYPDGGGAGSDIILTGGDAGNSYGAPIGRAGDVKISGGRGGYRAMDSFRNGGNVILRGGPPHFDDIGDNFFGHVILADDGGKVGIGTENPLNKLHLMAESDPLRLVGLQTSNQSEMLVVDANGVVSKRNINTGMSWMLSGNAATNPDNNFIGTTDNQALVFRTNNTERIRILNTGNVGIGINATNARLHVESQPYENNISIKSHIVAASEAIGIESTAIIQSAGGDAIAGYFHGINDGDETTSAYGVYGKASGLTGLPNYGIYGTATGSVTSNWAGYFEEGNVFVQNRLGLGVDNPVAALDISHNGSDNAVIGIKVTTTQNDENGINKKVYGGLFENTINYDVESFGVYGKVNTLRGHAYGIYGEAIGEDATVYGVFGKAINNPTHGGGVSFGVYATGAGGFEQNYGIYATAEDSGYGPGWAGYFDDGNVYIKNKLGLGTEEPSQQLELTGSIEMNNTIGPQAGVIYKGGVPFLHNFGPESEYAQNTFLGINSGNFSINGAGSGEGLFNTGIGSFALNSLFWGWGNTAIGVSALQYTTGGRENTALGVMAGRNISNGAGNIIIGYNAGSNITTGSNNIVIGNSAVVPNGTLNDQIVIGSADLFYGNIGLDRIGLGTIEPSEKLDIVGNIRTDKIIINNRTEPYHIQPETPWLFNDFAIFEIGKDEDFVWWGVPAGLYWSNIDYGNGRFEFRVRDNQYGESYINLAAGNFYGTWAGNTISVGSGGTGQTSLTAGKLLVGNGASGILSPTNLHWDNTNSRLGIGVSSPSNRLHISGTNPLRLEGLQTSSENEVLVVNSNGVVSKRNIGSGTFWSTTGNSGTNPSTNFIGTSDNRALAFRTFNEEHIRLHANGHLSIGTSTADPFSKLYLYRQPGASLTPHYGLNIFVENNDMMEQTIGLKSKVVSSYAAIEGNGSSIAVHAAAEHNDDAWSGIGDLWGDVIGIYATAIGGNTNWAGYFNDGNVYIKNNLGIGNQAPSQKLDVTGNIKASGDMIFGNNLTGGNTFSWNRSTATLQLGNPNEQDPAAKIMMAGGGGSFAQIENKDAAAVISSSTNQVGINNTPRSSAELDVHGTGAIIVPVGTTSQRPSAPIQGMIRYNTSLEQFEGYNGASWVILSYER